MNAFKLRIKHFPDCSFQQIKWFVTVITFLSFPHLTKSQDVILHKDDSLNRRLKDDINDTLKAQTYQALIELWKVKDFSKVIYYIKEAIEFCNKSNPRINSDGFKIQLGFQYMQVGDAVRSIEVFNEASKEIESSNQEYIQMVIAFIAMNYENTGDVKKALEYQLKASTIYERLNAHDSVVDRRGLLGNPHKTAVYYMKLNQLDSALKYGNQALDRLNKEPLNDFNRFFSWYIKTALGDIYSRLNDYHKALFYYNQAESEIKQYNSKEDLPPLYLGLSRLYFDLKEYAKAKQYGIQAYHIADTLKLYPLVKESAFFLKNIYSGLHIMDSALLFYDIAIAAKDSIFNADIARKIDAAEYADEKRNQERNAFQKEKSNQKKQLYLSTGILLSVLIAASLFQQNRIRQKANRLLEYENKEVTAQREQLSRDVENFEIQALKAQLNPHFIFNCLNSIDAFIYSNDKFQATTYLNKFAKLLRNILDSSKDNLVSLEKDIQSLRLYTELEELRNDHKFKTIYSIDEHLKTDHYVVPPLIIQPLVENAILHGLKNKKEPGGLLEINIRQVTDRLEYEIIDNGIGRAEASQLSQPKAHSYGMALTRSRIKLFNQEDVPSLEITDIASEGKILGTKILVKLILRTST